MATLSDADSSALRTFQSDKSIKPPTVAAATTIAPTTFITFVSGTTNVATITPPVTGAHMLTLIFTNASPGSILTTGNVQTGTTTITQKIPVLLFYDPSTAKYYPMRGAV